IRRHLDSARIADANAGSGFGKARPELAARMALAVKVHLDLRRGDKPICNQQVVGTKNFAADPPAAAEIESRFELDPIGRQPFDTQRAPGAAAIGVKVVTEPGL